VGRHLIEKAPSLYKEVPFTMKKQWDGEEILVQGVIDLLILEDECTIIDYKTDRSLAYCEQYLDQVGIYQEAVETVLGRPVKDALVAFVRLDKVIRRE
jgi:ATP-dependent exoDNAse (exonuclease V) beta subunit